MICAILLYTIIIKIDFLIIYLFFFRKADSNHITGSGGGEESGGYSLGGSRGVSIEIDMSVMEHTTTNTTTESTTIQQNGGKHVTLIQNGAKHKDDSINSCPVQIEGNAHETNIITEQVSLPEAGPSRPTTLDLNTRR